MATIEIDIGEKNRDYQVGNFVNAVDEVVAFFMAQTGAEQDDIADALEMMAKHYRKG